MIYSLEVNTLGINKGKERKVYTFTLHFEEDKELIEFLDHNKITKNVKKGLKMILKEERKHMQMESIDKDQLLNIISILTNKVNVNCNNIIEEKKSILVDLVEIDGEVDIETKREFRDLLQETGGSLGPINLNIPGY